MATNIEKKIDSEKKLKKEIDFIEMKIDNGKETSKIKVFGVTHKEDAVLFFKWLKGNVSGHFFNQLAEIFYHEHGLDKAKEL